MPSSAMGPQPDPECRGGRHTPSFFRGVLLETEIQGQVLNKHRQEEGDLLRRVLKEAEKPDPGERQR